MAGLAGVHELWLLYALFAVSGAVGMGGGPGGNLLTLVPVAKWFTLKRGRAMAISTAGLAIGVMVAVPLGAWLVDIAGWRVAWVVFGAALAGVATPLFAIFMRREPEDLGLRPDGETHAQVVARTRSGPAPAQDWTLREALRTSSLWLAMAAMSSMGLALTGTLVYRVDFWKSVGLSSGLVALATTMDPFTVIFASLVFGMVAERVAPRYLGFLGCALFALAMLPMIFAREQAYLVFLHNIMWGLAAGAYISMNNVIWPIFFGRRFLGAIRGMMIPFTIAVTGVSAPFYGYLLDSGMNPKLLWTVTLGLFVAASVLMLAAKTPRYVARPTR